MSGPKRADVQARLNQAQKAAQAAAATIAKAEGNALDAVMSEVDSLGTGGPTAAEQRLGSCRSDVPATAGARQAVDGARSAVDRAGRSRQDAQSKVKSAKDAQARSQREYDQAQAKYDEAKADLAAAGAHYLRREYEIAGKALDQFENAGRLGKAAASSRKEARQAATAALQEAKQARAAVKEADNAASAAERESAALTRAEEEARRIAEEARRRASIAVEKAQGAVDSLPTADCDKFAPGQRAKLETKLASARRALDGGESAGAQREAGAIPTAAASLSSQVAAAREEFNRRQAEATAALSQLSATIDASDRALISSWSDDPTALDQATAERSQIAGMIEREDFSGATSAATAADERVRKATETAAESKAADERRISIGDAIMDVLDDMAFDVFFEEGDKSKPLKITGQVPAENGEGDFKLEIPLSGEIDLEVSDTSDSASPCSNAVKNLRERLAARGVGMTVTDWGRGHEPAEPSGTGRVGHRENEVQYTKERG